MPHPPSSAVLRILDASLNRAAEGLRVVEDYVRFALNDPHLTERIKELRHDLAAAAAEFTFAQRAAARDTRGDVGASVTTTSEGQRADAWAACQASFERVKQSLRSLEEYAKVAAPAAAPPFESLRYRLYAVEAAAMRTVDAVERLTGVQLCVLVDGCGSDANFASMVEQLVAAGVHAIQIRDKRLADRQLVARARLLVEITRRPAPSLGPPSPPCLAIINDRPDVAAVVDADGVHLGQDDLDVPDARAIVGPQKLIGVSAHSLAQARTGVLAGANYLGVGPTFPSRTKGFDSFPGTELLRAVVAEIRLPAFAIGGISVGKIGDVLGAGFERIAVSSAVIEAENPAAAAIELLAALRRGR